MSVEAFLESATWPEIRRRVFELAVASTGSEPQELFAMMRVKLPVMIRFEFARITAAALVQKGTKGIALLREAFYCAPHTNYANAALEALYCASEGVLPPTLGMIGEDLPADIFREPSPETAAFARAIFEDVILRSPSESDSFDRISTFLSSSMLNFTTPADGDDCGPLGRFRHDVLRILRDSALELRPSLISEFNELIISKSGEETYQQFLSNHPVFLDPLADHVISKQKLGLEHVTDFALHKLDDAFVLVEIEKPQDRIFTMANDFTSQFVHALGQVLDFRSWIGQHTEYARSLMPGISASPPGLVVMGLRSAFSPLQTQKFRAFNENSSTVTVMTFDDLANQAETVYRNMTRRS